MSEQSPTHSLPALVVAVVNDLTPTSDPRTLIAESRELLARVEKNRPHQEARTRIARERLTNARRLLAKHLERR